jgi:ATP-dependent 26S proteasome regulatory subunit
MSAPKKKEKKIVPIFYPDNFAHITDELRKLDLIIQRRIMRFRQEIQALQEGLASRNVYITHDEVDRMLEPNNLSENSPIELTEINNRISILQNEINQKVEQSIKQGIFLALPQLAHIFNLTPFELQVVIICLAPELDRKYDKLFAYLQDDITRKKPSVDFVLNLISHSQIDCWQAGIVFSKQAPLFRSRMLETIDDLQSPSGSSDLARSLKLDNRIKHFVCGNNTLDGRLAGIAELYQPVKNIEQVAVDPLIKKKLINLTTHQYSEQNEKRRRLVLYLRGRYGIGKQELALGICGHLNSAMLLLDMEMLLNEGKELETFLRLAYRDGLLLQAAVHIRNVDILFEDQKYQAVFKTLAKVIKEYGWLTFLSGEKPWPVKGLFEGALFHEIDIPFTEVKLRETIWAIVLKNLGINTQSNWANQLVQQYRLTRSMNDGKAEITVTDLWAACRQQSNQKLAELALKIKPGYSWQDIVLPEKKLIQLKEICSQVKHRHQVFEEWGFDRKLSYGKGLSVLFSGPPGTGKTMAAEVIAQELQLDLYKIDLSGVVSKYIGETEKNLGEIFQEAVTSNAILFFDEADALFGKRTEVSDAHDRYANIETSYLLQKMEEYEGVVILATNLRENMDDAFTRRIRFIVEFPFPNEENRHHIWKNQFPKEAPLKKDIDYEFLSKQFRVAGGNIKNIALNAAFLAARNGNVIDMEHILKSTRTEFEKIGKLWDEKSHIKDKD